MTPNHWRRIEDLYNAAQARSPGEREELLQGADPEIRSRVREMLDLDSASQILDRPGASLLDHDPLETAGVDRQLGPYKIESYLGAGGMGTVYRAVDTRLGRVVAIKVVVRRYDARFEHEAQAMLNHPHICTLYDVGPNTWSWNIWKASLWPRKSQKAPWLPNRWSDTARKSLPGWPRLMPPESYIAI